MRNFFAPLAICAMLLMAVTDAEAQKKPKLKGLAKEMIGTWKFDDLALKLDESKASDEEKQQFTMAQAMIGMMVEQMKGKITFSFNPDYTYKTLSEKEGQNEEAKGTWSLDGNKLLLKPDAPTEEMPDSFFVSIIDKKLNLEASKTSSAISSIMKFIK